MGPVLAEEDRLDEGPQGSQAHTPVFEPGLVSKVVPAEQKGDGAGHQPELGSVPPAGAAGPEPPEQHTLKVEECGVAGPGPREARHRPVRQSGEHPLEGGTGPAGCGGGGAKQLGE